MSNGLDLRVIIAGGGEIGLRTAQLLDDRGHQVVLIEQDAGRCDELSDAYVASVIQGNATHPAIFDQARPEDADVVAGLTGDISANLAICMMGQHVNTDIHTVLRTDEETGDAHERLVDVVIHPEQASALLAVNAIMGGDVRSLEHVMGALEIMEVRVSENAPVANRRLDTVSFPTGSLVISDPDGARIARPEMVLEAGHRYIIAAEPAVVEEVMQLLRG